MQLLVMGTVPASAPFVGGARALLLPASRAGLPDFH